MRNGDVMPVYPSVCFVSDATQAISIQFEIVGPTFNVPGRLSTWSTSLTHTVQRMWGCGLDSVGSGYSPHGNVPSESI